ncbi:hypothetical protein LTS18_001142, partial [Coniosporium uncinatum]
MKPTTTSHIVLLQDLSSGKLNARDRLNESNPRLARWPTLSVLHRADFHIAVICVLPIEADAVEAMLDEFWED